MYADDLVEWLMTIAEHSNDKCPTFNVGSDQAILMGDLATMIGEEFGERTDVPEIISPNIDRYVPSIQRIRQQLGVELKYDLISAIKTTIFRIRSHV
jgi:dTDP-glucose 4,6-dehydratase